MQTVFKKVHPAKETTLVQPSLHALLTILNQTIIIIIIILLIKYHHQKSGSVQWPAAELLVCSTYCSMQQYLCIVRRLVCCETLQNETLGNCLQCEVRGQKPFPIYLNAILCLLQHEIIITLISLIITLVRMNKSRLLVTN